MKFLSPGISLLLSNITLSTKSDPWGDTVKTIGLPILHYDVYTFGRPAFADSGRDEFLLSVNYWFWVILIIILSTVFLDKNFKNSKNKFLYVIDSNLLFYSLSLLIFIRYILGLYPVPYFFTILMFFLFIRSIVSTIRYSRILKFHPLLFAQSLISFFLLGFLLYKTSNLVINSILKAAGL